MSGFPVEVAVFSIVYDSYGNIPCHVDSTSNNAVQMCM